MEPSARDGGNLAGEVVGSVLVIEDDVGVAWVLTRFLARLGYAVVVASSGAAAIRTFEAGRYRLMLCDVDLGDMDGINLAEDLRSIDPALPIVVMSGDQTHRSRALNAGFNTFLAKPCEAKDIRAAVDPLRGPSQS